MSSHFSFEDLKHKLWWEKVNLIKMTICLLLIKPQINMVEWPYIKYGIKKVFSRARIILFESFSTEVKM
jgi:hypothetical protein